MTILQTLCVYYDRLAATGAAPRLGYSAQQVSFAVILSSNGVIQDIQDMRDSSGKKPRPVYRDLPQPQKRTVQVISNLLWDKTSYVFGATAPDTTLSKAKAERALARTLSLIDIENPVTDRGILLPHVTVGSSGPATGHLVRLDGQHRKSL
jgi:CRISPR-associated protein Csd1